MLASLISKQIIIKGRVQNVGFRVKTKEQAIAKGVKGYVMNTAGGNVYVEAEGSLGAVFLFEQWCDKGSDWALVESVYSALQPLQY